MSTMTTTAFPLKGGGEPPGTVAAAAAAALPGRVPLATLRRDLKVTGGHGCIWSPLRGSRQPRWAMSTQTGGGAPLTLSE